MNQKAKAFRGVYISYAQKHLMGILCLPRLSSRLDAKYRKSLEAFVAILGDLKLTNCFKEA